MSAAANDTPQDDAVARQRASDADREQAARLIGEGLADGRLTVEEHGERLDAVFAAKTLGELAPLTADLQRRPPAVAGPGRGLVVDEGAAAATEGEVDRVVAVFRGASRDGRWLLGPQTRVAAVHGGVHLDLRRAVLTHRSVEVRVLCVMGGVTLTVPPGVRVVHSGTTFSGRTRIDRRVTEVTDPEAPVVHLTGRVLWGALHVRCKEGR
ncbi:DUF1707 SHOCT-like domain-containing protein [Streptomyces hoynatensis]|uniref:DUF1707 SHOCT-like domain-containing protein n=1 Tax=Streptomyces hoynatensis TaxID=1141874 RepID=UPI001319BD3B|nr:DUF1707 domain-containing protein [Streptomyces hoynatensis]